MKTVDDIKTLFGSAAIGTDPAGDKAVLADAVQAGGLTTRKRPAHGGPRIWRFLMESRITKLTAAGIVLAAAIIGIHHLNGTVVKAVEFSEIARAMGEVPWMHTSSSRFDPSTAPFTDYWVGFQSKVHAVRWTDGRVSFWDLQEHWRTEYDPSSNTIMKMPMTEDESHLNLSSPAMLLESMHKRLKDQGAEIVARMGDYDGHRVQVQEISRIDAGPNGSWSPKLTLYIDPHSKLLYAAEVSGPDPNGNAVIAGGITFDYPQTGPRDIYDLGVPRDAQVVDSAPANESRAVRARYEATRAEATGEYIAIITITQADPDDVVRRIDVDCRSQRKHRLERHSVFHNGESLDELWPQYKEQLGDSFQSLLSWTRNHYDDPRGILAIDLYDGEYYGSTIRHGENGWSERVKLHTSVDPTPPESLADLAWPRIGPTARIIEDDHASRNGLICIESLSQGRLTPGGWTSLPSRSLYYLDPSWDYLCRRQVTERRLDAPWQQDKDWLAGVDPNKVRHNSMKVDEITEAFQAPNGHWYPKVIVERSGSIDNGAEGVPPSVSAIKTIYLSLSPELPEGVFDINKLPGQ